MSSLRSSGNHSGVNNTHSKVVHIFVISWGQKQGEAWLHFSWFFWQPLDPGALIITLIRFWDTEEHTSFKGSTEGFEISLFGTHSGYVLEREFGRKDHSGLQPIHKSTEMSVIGSPSLAVARLAFSFLIFIWFVPWESSQDNVATSMAGMCTEACANSHLCAHCSSNKRERFWRVLKWCITSHSRGKKGDLERKEKAVGEPT